MMKHFNPHSHAGSDEVMLCYISAIFDFNPHSHAGSDIKQTEDTDMGKISIHTPTQGVTKCIRQILTNI